MKLSQLINEGFYFKNIDKAPSQWKQKILTLIGKHPELDEYIEGAPYSPVDTFIVFGRSGLPSEMNTVSVGNKFYDKKSQFRKLKGKVNTIRTYTDQLKVQGKEFIAKRNIGQRQQGQLINQLPDNPEDYIFQNLVEIIMEFRVIVYYMNGKYHVSGIYKKSGSNVSVSQIDQGSALGKVISQIAIKSTKILDYGLSGVDIAVVGSENAEDLILGENIVGSITSKATKLFGKLNIQELLDGQFPVVLEVNSFPSMDNPAIFWDLLKSIESNRA
jgi:hypothetical protein